MFTPVADTSPSIDEICKVIRAVQIAAAAAREREEEREQQQKQQQELQQRPRDGAPRKTPDLADSSDSNDLYGLD